MTYGDNDPEFTATVEGLVGTDTVTYTFTREQGDDVGTYAITPEGDAEQGNYTVTYVSGTLTIVQRDVTVTADDKTVTFGESDPTFTATVDGLVGTGTVTYQLSREDGTDIGTYTIYANGDADQGNYNVTFVNGTLTIEPAAVTVTADDKTKTFGESDPTFTATVEGLVGSDTVNYRIDCVHDEDAGTYEITVTGETEQGNYTVTFTNGTFTIDPKEVTAPIIAVHGNAYTYTGEEVKPVVFVYDGTTPIPADEFTVEYQNNVNAGTATVNIIDNDGGNYTVAGSTTFLIWRKNVVVTADPIQKGYGQADPELTYTAVGLIGNDRMSGALTRESGEALGTYAIKQGTLTAGNNYTVTFVGADFTIVKANVIVKADDLTKTFGEADPDFTATVTGVANGDTVVYTFTREPGENVGTYVITVTGDEDQGNYTVSFETGTLTITPADVNDPTIVPIIEGGTYTYDGTAKEPAVMVYLNGELINASEYSVEYENNVNAGTATITVVDNDGGNYTVTGTTTFLIWPKEITVTANDITKHYGDADPELTATVDGLIGTDTVDYTLTRAAGEDVGEYVITASGMNYQGNYIITFVNGTFTIECDEPIVTFRSVEIREHDTNDGKLDIRYLFRVQLNETKVDYMGLYYNGTDGDNRYEITSLAVIFVRSDVDPIARYIVNCNNIFAMHAEAAEPFFEYTAFMRNIGDNMMDWTFSVYARVGCSREGEETQYVYSEATEALSFGDLIDAISNN